MTELVEEIIERSPGLLRVKLPEVEGEYKLTCSPTLVQAFGKCLDVDFYFHAKYGIWVFETEDPHGQCFPASDPRRFGIGARYNESKSGAMGVEWASRLLRRCLAQWWFHGEY